MPSSESKPLSFADPAVQQCPFAAYDSLRDTSPVYRDPLTGNYVLTRYQDIRSAVINAKALSSKTGLGGTTLTRRRSDDSPLCLADDYKKAEADGLKRACRLLGIGDQSGEHRRSLGRQGGGPGEQPRGDGYSAPEFLHGMGAAHGKNYNFD